VFSQRKVKELLNRFVLVDLYTDVIPPKYLPTTTPEENRTFQNAEFGTTQLPLYVIVRPRADGTFEKLASYEEGKINDPDAFAHFLRKPLNGSTAVAQITK
jgi:hypothetical protein